MFVEITNTPRDYAWGSTTLLPDLLGIAPDGTPQAELWFGTHPGSPARLAGTDRELSEIAGELPFLLKLLAAGSPLSLQTHPNAAQAEAGFAREEGAGIPIDAPHRLYKDPQAKPEMILALSDEFRALSAFRPVAETRAVLDAVDPSLLDDLRTDDDLPAVVTRLLTTDVTLEVMALVADSEDAVGDSWDTVRTLAEHHPGDPGIAVSLLLHTVVLKRGEALYLPAGNIHAYLTGLGVELMGPSDNVLRAGLTPKHVDVTELLAVADFTPVADPRLAPATVNGGEVFVPEGAGWQLAVLSDTSLDVERGIAVVLEGAWRGYGPGRAAYLAAEAIVIPPRTRVAIASRSTPAGLRLAVR
jgi:mannose-6-phosphate isomerase